MKHNGNIARAAVALMGTTVALAITPLGNTIAYAGYDGLPVKTGSTANARVASARTEHYATPHIGQKFHGTPHHPGTIWAYDFTWQSHSNWWCTNYSAHSSDGLNNTTEHGSMPNFTDANAKAAFKIANMSYAVEAKVTGVSAPAKLHAIKAHVIWYLSKDKAYHQDFSGYIVPQLKAKGDMSGFNKLLAWSHDTGTYKVVVKAPKLSVGQTGHGTVVVTASNGKPASYLTVDVSGNDNVKLSGTHGTTNGKGRMTFSYKSTDYGLSKFTAKVTAPSSTTGLLTDASPGRQRLLTGNYHETAQGSTKYRTSGGTAEMSSNCPEGCGGKSTVTWTGYAPKGGTKPTRIKFEVNGSVTAHCDARASSSCHTTSQESDGSIWTGYDTCTLDKMGGSCISPWKHHDRNKEIICPPVPTMHWQLVLSGGCGCDGTPTLDDTSFTAAVTSLAGSKRYYTAELTDNTTGDTDPVVLTNGTPGAFSLPFHNGDEYQVSYAVYDHQGGTLLKSGTLFDRSVNIGG